MSKHAKMVKKFEKKVKITLELKKEAVRESVGSEFEKVFDIDNFDSKKVFI